MPALKMSLLYWVSDYHIFVYFPLYPPLPFPPFDGAGGGGFLYLQRKFHANMRWQLGLVKFPNRLKVCQKEVIREPDQTSPGIATHLRVIPSKRAS